MEQGRIFLGGPVSLPFPGQHVDQNGIVEPFHPFQGLLQEGEIMAVNGANILEAEGLKEHPWRKKPLEGLLGPFRHLQNIAAKVIEPHQKTFQVLLDLVNEFTGDGAGEEIGKRPHVFRDGHFVVVEDHHQVFVQVPGVIEPLVGDAAGHGAVPDDGNDLVMRLPQVTAHGKAEGS